MRIGFFADMYKPHLSGVTNHMALYKQRFEELGHEVFVLTYGNRDYVDTEPGVVRSPAMAWGKTGWQAGYGLAKEASELIPTLDIAHAHHPFLSGRVALAQCRPHGVPVVFTNHTRYDIYSDAYAWFIPRPLRMAYLRGFLHRFASQVDTVIAPSPGIRQWLCEFGVTCDALLMPNAIDTRPFAAPANPATRSDVSLPADSIVFCYLGRLGPEKNLPMLVDAFIDAAGRDERIALMLIGDGPSRGQATERLWAHGLRDRVHFTGMMPYSQVPDLLATADVFATASVSEVHPLVVLEAMAAGLPALGVRSPGVGDTVHDGATGFLTAEDPREFADRMVELAGDAALRERMGTAARDDALRYDIRDAADTLLGLYEHLIERKRTS
ncbi:MAG: glycosyltransferase [Actinomycetota bacterium]|nr:glycosyltransferase [Actinomycetota bacterium]